MSVFDNYQCEGQMSIFDMLDRDSLYGKMSPELLVQTKERTLGVSLKKFAELRIKPPQFLCLKRENGQQAVVSWVMGGQLLGEYMTRSFGESPKEEDVSRLSQILEVKAPEKYYLSARACQGILNRAERRGKELPEQLRIALIRQSVSKSEQDAPGGGKGILIQNERTGALSTLNNQAVCVNEVAETLDASYYKGCGERQGKEREVVCVGKAWDGQEVCSTLTANNAGGSQRMPDKDNFNAVLVLNDQGGSQMNVSKDVTATLRSEEHGHQPIVYGLDRASFNQGKNALYDFSVTEEQAQTLVSKGPGGGTSETVGALCARDYKGVGSQYVDEGKVIIQDV